MESYGSVTTANGRAENTLSNRAIKFFDQRKISVETLDRFKIYTDNRGGLGEVICFPYFKDGEQVNTKYRGPDKAFQQDRNGFKTFFNSQILDDPEFDKADQAPLVITEGEIDALSFSEAGYDFVMSIPDGAPQEPIGLRDIEDDHKYEYIWNNWEKLKKVKRIILAVDADGPGQALRQDLIDRFGAIRCLEVSYPDGCKDANDVLIGKGFGAVLGIKDKAKSVPIKGLYKFDDYPDEKMPTPIKLQTLPWLNKYLNPYLGAFMVLTGIPSHGKSTLANHIVVDICQSLNCVAAVGSFESRPRPMFLKRLLPTLTGKNEESLTPDDVEGAKRWLNDHIVFIDQEIDYNYDDDADIIWILDRAEEAVLKYSAKVLLLDPWNEIEHKRRRDESETEYTARAIRLMKRFARVHNVLVIVVAHPTKPQGTGGESKPTLYNVSGSSHWYNKADIGVVVHKPEKAANLVGVFVEKIRERFCGKPGKVDLEYDVDFGVYRSPNDYDDGQNELIPG